MQMMIPKIGTSGTRGVLNGRLASGFVILITQMPAHTKINAKSVPKLVKSPATLPGTNPPKSETNTNRIMFDLKGVRNLG